MLKCTYMYSERCSCDRSLGVFGVFSGSRLCKCDSFRLMWLKVSSYLCDKNKRQSGEVALMEAPQSSKSSCSSLELLLFHL